MGDLGLEPRSVGLKVPYNYRYTNRPFSPLYHTLSTCQHQFFRFSLTTTTLTKSGGLGVPEGFLFGQNLKNCQNVSLRTAPVGLEPTTTSLTAKRTTIVLQGNILLCSNCHSQTPTYAGKNARSGLEPLLS